MRLAARSPGRSQKDLFEALGESSGSRQKAVVDEVLFRHAFIRRERRGRSWLVSVTEAGYAYLGLEAPKGRGVGGSLHQRLVERVAADFRRNGFDCVRIECPVGPMAKRVDVVAIGPRRVGIEVGISSADQEVRNLT